ncbi:cytochrome P450 [Mycena alexandri]|uniref:Cytochrome P450 n=1 Tax=Mycena alexandri TaxID=1745969 RepID=A0AAD6X2F5_9AGAR|nr:cytochrome P450 [Mycena alexandri]
MYLLVLTAVLAVYVYFRFRTNFSLPFIGNALSIPSSHQWIAFSRWGKEYGKHIALLCSDIIHLDVCGTSIVVLNSYNAAIDLLDKRSAIYPIGHWLSFRVYDAANITSSRPKLIMARELMGWENTLFFQPYGSPWLAGRRLMHEQFQSSAATRFHPQQIIASHHLLSRLLESPQDFSDHIRHAAGSLSMSIAYGIETLRAQDPLIETAAASLAAVVVAANPGSFLVDVLPFLKHVPAWVPGAGFQRKARQWKQETAKMVNIPFQITKQALTDGVAAPSFTRHGLESMDAFKDAKSQEELIKWTAADIYVGDVAAIQTFMLGMLANPEAMKAAQAEIDTVVRPGFLPTFEDEERLPYISAIRQETLRWNNVTPMAVPHSTTEEDIYQNYRIPAGSVVLANVWAMTHDEHEYPEPFKFRPERFLKDRKLDLEVRDPTNLAFGFGRRVCPGQHLGSSFLWIVIASILSSFDITKAVDKGGKIVEPSYAYLPGLVGFPVPFRCSVQPRSREKANLVKMLVEG